MTELAEKALMNKILSHKHDDETCLFCRSNEDEKPDNPKSDADSDWNEDPAKLIGNSSGKLETKMKNDDNEPRPTDWELNGSDNRELALNLSGDDLIITPNPHHIIPGNESLKEVSAILKWIFASKNHIKSDIGYDVNNCKNGIWLPSNNTMRKHSSYTDQKTEESKKKKDSKYTKVETNNVNPAAALPFKKCYAVGAMRSTGRQFHDRHLDYSKFIRKILQKIADRMDKREEKTCIEAEKKKGREKKFDPPYALVTRLNGVSKRFKPYLALKQEPKSPIFASKLAKAYWPDKF